MQAQKNNQRSLISQLVKIIHWLIFKVIYRKHKDWRIEVFELL